MIEHRTGNPTYTYANQNRIGHQSAMTVPSTRPIRKWAFEQTPRLENEHQHARLRWLAPYLGFVLPGKVSASCVDDHCSHASDTGAISQGSQPPSPPPDTDRNHVRHLGLAGLIPVGHSPTRRRVDPDERPRQRSSSACLVFRSEEPSSLRCGRGKTTRALIWDLGQFPHVRNARNERHRQLSRSGARTPTSKESSGELHE